MRHRRKGSRLNRKSNQLKALLRNLVTSLVLNGEMVTTISKAKALIPVFDRLVITIQKKDEMNGIRAAQKILFGTTAQKKMVQEIVPGLKARTSGFCSLLKIGTRAGDNASVVRIQILVEGVENVKSTAKKEAKKAEKAKTTTKKASPKKTTKKVSEKKPAAKKTTKKAPAKKAPAKKAKKEEVIPEQK